MRHQVARVKLGMDASHRRAFFANMASSLIEHEQIKTTLPKAKALRPYVEKLITLGKKGSLHARRTALAILYDGKSVDKLFSSLAQRYVSRQGGYTRIVKAGFRRGDAADMAIIELIERDVDKKESPTVK